MIHQATDTLSTALHVAASENFLEVAEQLLKVLNKLLSLVMGVPRLVPFTTPMLDCSIRVLQSSDCSIRVLHIKSLVRVLPIK